jgi:hypothetical protein|tara:strand:- start:982 stop:1224 length:243 start_codon:yes stop_codon:yes gene_type:complete
MQKVVRKQKDNPKQYFINHEVLCLVWKALHESGNTELAQVVATSMQAQGCQELDDAQLEEVLAFWNEYLQDKIKTISEVH